MSFVNNYPMPLNDTKKINLDKKDYLQSQTNQYTKIQNFQSSLLSLSYLHHHHYNFKEAKKI